MLPTLNNYGVVGELTMGQAERLHSQGVAPSHNRAQLRHKVSTNELYRRVVGLVIDGAMDARFQITGISDELAEALDGIILGYLQKFSEAQYNADTLGETSFLLLSTFGENGNQLSRSKLANGSAARVELAISEKPLTKEGEFYYWRDIFGNKKTIHGSRVLEILPRSGGSLLARFEVAYQLYRASLLMSIEAMGQGGTVTLTKRGLDEDIAGSSDPEGYVANILTALVESRRKHGILLLDGRYSADSIKLDLGDAKDVIDRARDFMVSASGLTARQLLNETPAGTVGEDPDSLALAKQIDHLLRHSWGPALQRLVGYLRAYTQAKVKALPIYEASAAERSRISLEHARAAAIYMDYQVLLPEEVRHAWEGGSFTPTVELNQRYKPPRVLNKHKVKPVQNIDRSRIQPENRGLIDPSSGDLPTNPSETRRASDEELRGALQLVGFGKSQPRLATLRKIEDRAFEEGDDVSDRLYAFCLAWLNKDGDTEDSDLLPPSRR